MNHSGIMFGNFNLNFDDIRASANNDSWFWACDGSSANHGTCSSNTYILHTLDDLKGKCVNMAYNGNTKKLVINCFPKVWSFTDPHGPMKRLLYSH